MKIDRRSRKYKWWRFGVFLRDKVCQACENPNEPEAHHINSAKYHPEQAYDVKNGIILCDDCHRFLHGQICGGTSKFCNHEHLDILLDMKWHLRVTRKKKERLLKAFEKKNSKNKSNSEQ